MFQSRSKVTIRALGYFLLNPDKNHYVNELAKILDVDVGNLFRKLQELEKEGVLISEKQGNQRYYSLNKSYPFLKELQRYYEARHGLAGLIQEKLKQVEGLKEAYLFGSFTEGPLGKESDIDLMLVGGHSPLEVRKTVSPLEKRIGREINIVHYSTEEFREKRQQRDDFLESVFSGQIIKIC